MKKKQRKKKSTQMTRTMSLDKQPETGIKKDSDILKKPPLAYVPLRALWETGKVMGLGAEKYTPYNWAGGIRYTRLISAAMRHIVQFACGDDLDEETGISHIIHAICSLMMLHEMYLDRPDLDDRNPNIKQIPWRTDAKKED